MRANASPARDPSEGGKQNKNKPLASNGAASASGGMVQRTPPKSRQDDRKFPIRLKFKLPEGGQRAGGWLIENWLRDNLGDQDHAVHTMGGLEYAVYLRRVADAQRLVDAFPDAQLADGVAEEYGLRKPRRPIHETWHSTGPFMRGHD